MRNSRVLLSFVLAAIAGATQAATITFESAPRPIPAVIPNAAPGEYQTAEYIESGFKMERELGHYDIYRDDVGGSNYVNIDNDKPLKPPTKVGPSKITFSEASGSPFNLVDFEVIKAGNGFITSSNGWSEDLSAPGKVSLGGPQWSGITSFSFESRGDAFVGIDNINVTAVPEPDTYAMLALGLLAIAGFARRRQA